MAKKPHYQTVKAAIRKSKKSFTANEVKAAFQNSNFGGLYPQTLDSRYLGLSRYAWDLVVAYDDTNVLTYIAEEFDCDNFMIVFAGNCMQKWKINGVGLAIDFSGGHAYNVLLIVEDDGSLSIAVIEPQNDEFVIKDVGMYDAEVGVVIFA